MTEQTYRIILDGIANLTPKGEVEEAEKNKRTVPDHKVWFKLVKPGEIRGQHFLIQAEGKIPHEVMHALFELLENSQLKVETK